jgi:hypothetical protein
MVEYAALVVGVVQPSLAIGSLSTNSFIVHSLRISMP